MWLEFKVYGSKGSPHIDVGHLGKKADMRSVQQMDRSRTVCGLAAILSYRIYCQSPVIVGFGLRELVFLSVLIG